MKKTVFTLDIGNYLPDLTKYTFPLIKYWAEKIGADFQIVTEDKFTGYSPSYNKFQIFELGKDNDFNIFVDADTFIHPDFFDITSILKSDEALFTAKDFLPIRFKLDDEFLQDGRMIGACSWFIVTGKEAHNLWKPSELTAKEIQARIFPTQGELKNIGIKPEHLMDDFTFSKNITRYRLDYCTYFDLQQSGRIFDKPTVYDYLMHNYAWSKEEKVEQIGGHVRKLGLVKYENDKLVSIL